ncbi:MAG: hypothetical protein ACT4QF_12790 [Sporichthyaceae bacterium]
MRQPREPRKPREEWVPQGRLVRRLGYWRGLGVIVFSVGGFVLLVLATKAGILPDRGQ